MDVASLSQVYVCPLLLSSGERDTCITIDAHIDGAVSHEREASLWYLALGVGHGDGHLVARHLSNLIA